MYASVADKVDADGAMAGVALGSLNAYYGADSANNAKHPELWVRNAALLPAQLDELLAHAHAPPARVAPVSAYDDPSASELKRLLDLHGSDKASRHSYHRVYATLLSRLGAPRAPLRLLEIGLGSNDPAVLSTMGAGGRPGASVRAFRDFLPHAAIFGADVDAASLLADEPRIRTHLVDQFERRSFDAMHAAFGAHEAYDLIIDDGLHAIGPNLNTLLWALAHVRPGGYVVIEDIGPGKLPHWRVVDALLRHRGAALETAIVDTEPQKMYVVHVTSAAAA